MNRKGFSLAEVLVCLSIILILGSISTAYLKNSAQAVKKRETFGSLAKTSNNFLEELKTVPFGSLMSYHNQTLANGKIQVQVIGIDSHLYKIILASDSHKLETITLRSDYE
jgi:prepilin-type N-terminal cleavage/methylation domain-containing protein